MKKSLFLLVSVLLFSFIIDTGTISAQTMKTNAKKFINRTNVTLKFAKEVVKANKVYTGNLVKANAHQKLARKLYIEGNYRKAVSHSFIARKFAFKAIKANKRLVQEGMDFNQEELNLAGAPKEDQLEAEVVILKNMTDETVAEEQDVDVE